ncbi:MAG: putative nuclease [Alphaproteobacteria bacterium]|jgi:phosphatidylserine/phosphatidylglycerophosphate/cardiolipin synthase-like enzyme|nr:putative nuclease [Alphaproteobacteria bacterium]
MKRRKRLKAPSSPLLIILFLGGFGAGYTAKKFTPSQQTVTAPPHHPSQPTPSSTGLPVSVCFTPNKQCQLQIINEINKAKKSVHIQAYSFTDQNIAQALVDASRRGVMVKALLDKSNRKDSRSAKDLLIQNNIPLRFDSPPGIAHNKIIIIDGQTLITGSYNFSAAAYKRNTENLLVINSPTLVKDYMQNWLKRWDLSQPPPAVTVR